MADHDPFCFDPVDWCICDRLRAARTDEQDTKFAQLDHAEAVAARLVEVICEDAESEAWLEDSNQQLQGQITGLIQTGYKLRRERDLARAELAGVRERIAQEIEAVCDAVSLRIEVEQMRFPMDYEQVDAWASERVGLNRAARIARGDTPT